VRLGLKIAALYWKSKNPTTTTNRADMRIKLLPIRNLGGEYSPGFAKPFGKTSTFFFSSYSRR